MCSVERKCDYSSLDWAKFPSSRCEWKLVGEDQHGKQPHTMTMDMQDKWPQTFDSVHHDYPKTFDANFL